MFFPRVAFRIKKTFPPSPYFAGNFKKLSPTVNVLTVVVGELNIDYDGVTRGGGKGRKFFVHPIKDNYNRRTPFEWIKKGKGKGRENVTLTGGGRGAGHGKTFPETFR